MPGNLRIEYITSRFDSEITPLNYVKAIHVTIYGLLCIRLLGLRMRHWQPAVRRYATLMTVVYVASALLQSYLTIFAETYNTFIMYFFLASTLILVVGYVLYFKPEVLRQIEQKYFTSSLSKSEREQIAEKIIEFLYRKKSFLNPEMNLGLLSTEIGEKKHRVSQTLSQELNASFSDLINSFRVEYSKQLLRNPDFDKYSVLGIALEVGFTNKSTFNRAFAKIENNSPSEFRKKRTQIII